MKKIISISILTWIFSLTFIFTSSAEAEKAEGKKNVAQKVLEVPADTIKAVAKPLSATDEKAEANAEKEPKTATDADLRDHIAELLDIESEAMASIPDLKKEDGGYVYQGKNLKDMTGEELDEVYKVVIGEVGRIRAERLNQQIQQIAQAARTASARQPVTPPAPPPAPPPQPPKAGQPPPAPPSAPPQVYNPPKPQQPPPAPPSAPPQAYNPPRPQQPPPAPPRR